MATTRKPATRKPGSPRTPARAGARLPTRIAVRLRPLLEDIEPRILMSADDPIGLGAAAASATATATAPVLTAPLLPAGVVTPTRAPITVADTAQAETNDPAAGAAGKAGEAPTARPAVELVFVDDAIENVDALIDDLMATSGEARQVEVFRLDPKRDAIEQITRAIR